MCNLWFFYLKKKCFILKILRFFVFWNSQVPKSEMSSQALLHKRSYSYAYFFCILSTMKMKCCQILVCCMTHTSNIFSAQCWRLETSSRPFYNFIKKDMETSSSPPNCSKDSWKFLSLLMSISWPSLWLNELSINQYISKCILSHVLIISIITSQIS